MLFTTKMYFTFVLQLYLFILIVVKVKQFQLMSVRPSISVYHILPFIKKQTNKQINKLTENWQMIQIFTNKYGVKLKTTTEKVWQKQHAS